MSHRLDAPKMLMSLSPRFLVKSTAGSHKPTVYLAFTMLPGMELRKSSYMISLAFQSYSPK